MKIAKRIVLLAAILFLGACGSSDEELDGATLFASKGCTNCHDTDGSGVEGQGPAINDGTKTATNIRNVIAKDGSPMAGFSSLTDDEIEALGKYVSTLGASSKLMKVTASVDGNNVPGFVIAKDNTGKTIEGESDSGVFSLDITGLQAPIVFQFMDDDQEMYAIGEEETELEIDDQSSEALEGVAEMFEACEEDSQNCFDKLLAE